MLLKKQHNYAEIFASISDIRLPGLLRVAGDGIVVLF